MPTDVIVVGLGVMGSATVDALARQGRSVIGIERYQQGHALGSSHGPTRHHPPEHRGGSRLRAHRAGRLRAVARPPRRCAPADHRAERCHPHRAGGFVAHAAFRTSAAAWGLPYETLDRASIVERFPGFAVPDGYEGVFEDGRRRRARRRRGEGVPGPSRTQRGSAALRGADALPGPQTTAASRSPPPPAPSPPAAWS